MLSWQYREDIESISTFVSQPSKCTFAHQSVWFGNKLSHCPPTVACQVSRAAITRVEDENASHHPSPSANWKHKRLMIVLTPSYQPLPHKLSHSIKSEDSLFHLSTLQLWQSQTDCEHFSTEQPRCRLARVMIALASRLSDPITEFAL